ncbi:MAG: hypothetical protein APU95_03060 [Hadesarchaea archaeon YNP_N21]|nr:MAG: hypothetical protein APU95_03060 [Hadesarchaea archaeon YNP_N21]
MKKEQKYDFKRMEREHEEMSAIILEKLFADPLAKLLIKHTNVKPNDVTVLSFVFLIMGSIFLLRGAYWYQVLGATFALIYIILDCVDGSIARVKDLCTKFGQWLDGIIGFVSHPLLIFCLAVGIGTQQALILGSLAMIAYPMQYLITRFYKLDILGKDEPISIGKQGKYEFVRYLYGSTLFFLVLFIFVIINLPILVLWVFAVFGNLFWIITIILEGVNLKQFENAKLKSTEKS